ncbi:hypothetical protein [Helicobacter apodemus]|uniref:Uncharacterized protein n=1 Tax=Helicobacter apodemus TaxID=135569 RepID=A0A2U8FBL3_9HELI|nr:hypothetical protein [Helicobacter apodemus]AWI33526.1 hypothetical protein CDV25_01200 [Helicobacter apodemus]
MQIFILNFKRSKVHSVIEALQLSNLVSNAHTLKEISINDFFDDSMYSTLKEVEFINSNHHSLVGGGGH